MATSFARKNLQMRSGTIETSNSSGKHAVSIAQIHRLDLGTTETCNSGPKVAVLHAQNHR